VGIIDTLAYFLADIFGLIERSFRFSKFSELSW